MNINYTNCEGCYAKNICRFSDGYINYIRVIAEALNGASPENVDSLTVICKYSRPAEELNRPQVQDRMPFSQQQQPVDRLSGMNPSFMMQPQSQQPRVNLTPEQMRILMNEKAQTQAQNQPNPPVKKQ